MDLQSQTSIIVVVYSQHECMIVNMTFHNGITHGMTTADIYTINPPARKYICGYPVRYLALFDHGSLVASATSHPSVEPGGIMGIKIGDTIYPFMRKDAVLYSFMQKVISVKIDYIFREQPEYLILADLVKVFVDIRGCRPNRRDFRTFLSEFLVRVSDHTIERLKNEGFVDA